MSEPMFTVVLPTRDEPGVAALIRQLAGVHSWKFDVIVVDDSNDDLTRDAALRMNRYQGQLGVEVVARRASYERAGGLASAVVHGIAVAKTQHVIVMDADGQHPANVLPALVMALQSGNQIVVASRNIEGGSSEGLDGPWRRFVSKAATGLAKLMFPYALRGITDPMSGCFAVNKKHVQLERLGSAGGFKVLLALLATHPKLRRCEVPIVFGKRQEGQSKAGVGVGLAFLRQLITLRFKK